MALETWFSESDWSAVKVLVKSPRGKYIWGDMYPGDSPSVEGKAYEVYYQFTQQGYKCKVSRLSPKNIKSYIEIKKRSINRIEQKGIDCIDDKEQEYLSKFMRILDELGEIPPCCKTSMEISEESSNLKEKIKGLLEKLELYYSQYVF